MKTPSFKPFHLLLLVIMFFTSCGSSHTLTNVIVEASCGQCNFALNQDGSAKGCDLAIRYQGKAYFVEGTGIDDHGDAHAEDGFCQRIRKAKVSGEFKEGRFHAQSFELLPQT